MAQVMINFRMDEETKKSMEQACREMGLTMTTVFTIFAKKVGKEKRIPFEVTAEPCPTQQCQAQRRRAAARTDDEEERLVLTKRQERLELLCGSIRRSLTAIHVAVPAAITGLSMERIRLLCGDELKDKAAAAAKASRALFSGKTAGSLMEKDLNILDEYTDALSAVEAELLDLERTLVPDMKSWQGGNTDVFVPYERRLAAVSRRFDELPPVLNRFLCSTACRGGARMVQARLRQAAASVETPYVLTALDSLEALVVQHYDSLDEQTKTRLESGYLQTLELTLEELGQAERDGADTGGKAALCLRAVNVLSQVIERGGRARQEWSRRSLEAEVEALERLAAMRGDLAGSLRLEG